MDARDRQGGFPLPGRVAESLPLKVMLATVLIVAVGSGLFWHRTLLRERRILTESEVEFAATFSDLLKKGVRGGMLHYDREEIQHEVSTVATSELVRSVRIYNRRGTVSYSSAKGELGRTAGRHEKPCVGCHADSSRPSESLLHHRRYAIFREGEGPPILSYVEPIYNEPDCANALCHAHEKETRVLGILLTDFSLALVERRVGRQFQDAILFGLILIVVLTAVGYLVLWRLVLRPVRVLSRGIARVSAGELGQTIPVRSGDEIGRLTDAFNRMTAELSTARVKTQRWTQSLEEEVAEKTEEVRRTEGKLAEAEKFAALGRLTAEIAHEVRNPLTALGGYGRRLLRMVASSEEKRYAGIVVREAERLEQLLEDILEYSRPARYRFERRPVEPILEETLAAFGERFEGGGIRVETRFEGRQAVMLDSAQVRRAFDNLVANAADAMPEGGVLAVATRVEVLSCVRFVAVEIADSGGGIEEEHLPRLFEPFFTSKRSGQGTGLGLPITRKIIEAHGAFLQITNRPEGGVLAKIGFPLLTEADLTRTPCWEAMGCGRTGEELEPCPAYPHFGRACWVVAGTLCEGRAQGTFAQKLGDCRRCDFFRKVTAEQA